MQVKEKTISLGAVKYSEPVDIGTRSVKHLDPSAYNHLAHMERIQKLPEFERSFKNSQRTSKN